MKFFKQKRALGFSRASLIIGICIIPAWFLSLAAAYWSEGTGTDLLWGIFFVGMPLVALAGLILGVIGLIGSIRKESHSTKGIVLASIGIVLTLAETAFTVCVTLIALTPDVVALPI